MDGNDIKKIFGSSLQEIRKTNDITQEKLAELIGKDKNTINRIETGINFVTSDTYADLCNVLNIHPSILMTQRPEFLLGEHINYRNQINQLLKTFPTEKLRDAYNILCAMNK